MSKSEGSDVSLGIGFAIGCVYEMIKEDYRSAISWYEKSISEEQRIKSSEKSKEAEVTDRHRILRITLEMRRVCCLRNLQKIEECVEAGTSLLRSLEGYSDLEMKAGVLFILGECFLKKNEVNKSLRYARRMCSLSVEHGMKMNEISSLYLIARTSFLMCDFSSSIEVLGKCMKRVKKIEEEGMEFPSKFKRDIHKLMGKSKREKKKVEREVKKISKSFKSAKEKGKGKKLINIIPFPNSQVRKMKIDPRVFVGVQYHKEMVKIDGIKTLTHNLQPVSEKTNQIFQETGTMSPCVLRKEVEAFLKKEKKRKRKMIKCGFIGCGKNEGFEIRFKMCARCRRKYYCSVNCQKRDWKNHKKVCVKK